MGVGAQFADVRPSRQQAALAARKSPQNPRTQPAITPPCGDSSLRMPPCLSLRHSTSPFMLAGRGGADRARYGSRQKVYYLVDSTLPGANPLQFPYIMPGNGFPSYR